MDDFVIEVFKPSTEKPTDFADKGLMKFYLCDGNFLLLKFLTSIMERSRLLCYRDF